MAGHDVVDWGFFPHPNQVEVRDAVAFTMISCTPASVDVIPRSSSIAITHQRCNRERAFK